MSKKVLFLDGAVFSNNTASFSTSLMNEFHSSLNKPERIDLNDTEFGKLTLCKNTFPAYWGEVNSDKWINKLKEVDVLVLSSTMINFTVPSVVKNFIDGIALADKTFSYKMSKDGNPVGLLNNLNVILITSQGGPQAEGTKSLQVQWLEQVFKFVGAKSINFIEINGTKMPNFAGVNPQEYAKTRLEEFENLMKKF
ncbi:azoreductase [Mycoplasmopsis canis UF31]|uniref:FMN-dependent NADH-azoreductase n=1 Tax=Mycoplasmopsis canis TaxID=29555 RepID=UPI00025AEC6A|nr:FMN-dependent NADH-azoreductase [Mycoplasmopsis canis]EIE40387.1 azoreductase [Mycoplasmopsis canis UF31]